MEQDEKIWLEEALTLAQKAAAEDEVPVGAMIIHQGQVIARAYNLREQAQDPIAHAEILAIREAAAKLGTWRLNACTLVVTLEPCPMCLGASQQARIGQIIYGARDSKGGALSLGYRLHEDSRTHHRFSVNYFDYPPCGQILKDFFEKKRRPEADS